MVLLRSRSGPPPPVHLPFGAVYDPIYVRILLQNGGYNVRLMTVTPTDSVTPPVHRRCLIPPPPPGIGDDRKVSPVTYSREELAAAHDHLIALSVAAQAH